MNSAVGFLKSWMMLPDQEGAGGIDWTVVGTFAGLGAVGGLVGNMMSERIPQRALRRAFSVFLVVMAAYILMRQAPKLLSGENRPVEVENSTAQLEPAGAGTAQRSRAAAIRTDP